MGNPSSDFFHYFAEASQLCWPDRIGLAAVGSPGISSTSPSPEMLSEKSADEKAARVRSGHITSSGVNILPGGPHTANISAADKDGNFISITATQGNLFGSGVVIDGMGLIMGHGMSRFDFLPNHPNAPQPGKRMHHNMSPVLITRNSKPIAALGLPGGTKIVSVTAQLVMNLIDFSMPPAKAAKSPRIHAETDEPISVSADTPQSVIDSLTTMGHTVRIGQDVGGKPNEIGGQANIIASDANGNLSAASGAGNKSAASQ